MFILLISSKNRAVVREVTSFLLCHHILANENNICKAIRFGINLLIGGNARVQTDVYNFLVSTRVEFFFDDLRSHIQQAVRMIKSKKISKKQKWRQQFNYIEEDDEHWREVSHIMQF